MKFNSFKKGVIALACMPLALAAGSAAAAQWHATETGAFNTGVAVKLGKEDDNKIIHVQVSLKLHNKSELDNLVSRMNTRGDSMFGTSLPHEQVANRYLPTREEALAVANHLTQYGAKNITISKSNMLIDADIAIKDARSAFDTDFARFNLDGKEGFANTRGASLPEHLNALAVLGLDNLHEHHTLSVRAGTDATTSTGFNPTAFPKAYGISTASTGSNTVIGIITSGNLAQTQTDLTAFEKANGITPVTVKIEGAGGSGTSGTDEWNLDSQDIVAMSGGVKQLTLYDAASLSDAALTTVYDLAVSDNTAKGINVSLGACEKSEKTSGGMATDDQIYETASAQGQTFFAASGDSNADECKFWGFLWPVPGDSYPASSPYVTSVGGTSLKVTSSGTYSSETVWDTTAKEGTGGGASLEETEPSWQNSVKAITGGKRGVPDVAFDADPETGAIITVNGKSVQVGGTSLATPLATGLWARAQSAHGNSLGFAASLIYALPSSDFHDVTSGNNNGYSAGAGWDYCTGFGSAVGDAYVNGL